MVFKDWLNTTNNFLQKREKEREKLAGEVGELEQAYDMAKKLLNSKQIIQSIWDDLDRNNHEYKAK